MVTSHTYSQDSLSCVTTLYLKTRRLWNLSKCTRNIALWLSCLSYTVSDRYRFLLANSLGFQLPTPPALARGSFPITEPALPLCGEGQEFTSPSSPPQITDRCVGITILASSPLGQNDFEVCFVHWFPEFSGRIKLQESTVVTFLMMCSY